MSTVAIIPARGGSKGILDKNLQPVHGVPLVARAVRSAVAAVQIDQVYVSTDSSRIASVAEANGAKVINRPATLSGDEASSESAILHALDEIGDADVVAFIQCTTPFIEPLEIDRACRMIKSGEFDSVFSGSEDHSFRWLETERGIYSPEGHSLEQRTRRQDLGTAIIETGAFYVFKAENLRIYGSRFHGRVGSVVTSKRNALQIDTAEDLNIARQLASQDSVRSEFGPIEAVVFDFDGVHTDDSVWLDQEGRETVRVSRSDGYGVRLLRASGIRLLILSMETNPVVAQRATKLQIEVIQGENDKGVALRSWLTANALDPARVAYLGNDVNDIPALEQVGWPVVVADAHPAARVLGRLILRSRGGEGAVRELADLILEQGTSNS